MKTVMKSIYINATPEKVFEIIDDLGVTGMYMTQSSTMMMGSKLHLQYLTSEHRSLGSKYSWTGKMMGMKMNFTVEVTKWMKGVEKTWETIGKAKMIIYSWYQMHLLLFQKGKGTQANLSITYKRPKAWLYKLIFFLADWYCRSCLKNMLYDTKEILEANNQKTFFMKSIFQNSALRLALLLALASYCAISFYSLQEKIFR